MFGAVTLTKNADIDKYGYPDYGIGFDRRGSFSFPSGRYGQNILIFGVDMSFLVILIIKKRHISIRNRSNTRIRTYFNCRKTVFHEFYSNKKESLIYNGANSYSFVNGTEIYKFKAKDSEIVTYV